MLDILPLKVQPSVNKEPIYIINAYNISIRSKQAGKSVDTIIKVSELLYKCIFIMKNFNLYYTNWNKCTINFIIQIKRFVDWIVNKNAIYKLKVGTSTYT